MIFGNRLGPARISALLKNSVLLLSLFLLFGRSAQAQEVVSVGGTGGVLAITKLLAEKFQKTHPDVKIKVLPSLGSSGGIKAVLAGVLDIGLSSRLLNNQEQGAVVRELARTPFVFATGTRTALTKLRSEEILAIYNGVMKNWPDGSPVRLVLRPASEYDTVLLKSISADMDKAVSEAIKRKGMIMAVTDQDSADAIERVPGAVGTGTLGQIVSENRSIRPLILNGIKPSADMRTESRYPYLKSFYLVHKQMPKPAARAFIDFIYSEPGRDILTRSGYLVMRN